jgi:hypothetical protein
VKPANNDEPELVGIVQFNGWAHHLWNDGTLLPVVSGGADDNEDDEDEEEDDNEPKGKKPSADVQAELTRVGTKERKIGKQMGKKELAKSLGFEDDAALSEFVKTQKEAADAKKSEDEKAQDKLLKDQQAVEKEKADAAREKFEARCERALLRGGVPEKVVEKAIKLLDLEASDNPDADDIKDAVTALKDEMPQLFKGSSSDDDENEDEEEETGNPPSNRGKAPKPKGGKKSSEEQAKEIMARRHPKKDPIKT